MRIYGKLGNEIKRRKQRQQKLKESTRLEGQNIFFIFFVICDLRKQKTIIGRIFLNLKWKKKIYEYR